MTRAPHSRPASESLKALWLLAVLLLASLTAWHGFDVATSGPLDRSGRLKAPDFLQFYTYGSLARAGEGQGLYDGALHAAVAASLTPPVALTEFRPNYPPLIAWLMAPLAGLPYTAAMAWFAVLSVMTYTLAVWSIIRRTVSISSHTGLALVVAFAYPTLFALLRYGQLSALGLAVVAVAALAARDTRVFTAGVILGLLAYKPPLLVVPFLALVVAGQRALVWGMLTGVFVEMAANALIAGASPLTTWAHTLATLAMQPDLVQFFPTESHSIRGFVRLLLGPGRLAQLTGLVAPLAVALAVSRVWKSHADWRPRWAALVLGAFLGSPHVLTYDLLMLALPMLLVLDWRLSQDMPIDRSWFWALAGCYFAAWPGTFIARLVHIQPSTVAMTALLVLLTHASAMQRPHDSHVTKTIA